MAAPFARRRAATLAELTLGRVSAVAQTIASEGFGSSHLDGFVDLIASRAERVRTSA